MNETLKRSLSGLIYIVLLIAATLYSKNTFLLLFGSFLWITIFEFCKMIGLPKLLYSFIGTILFALYVLYFNTIESVSTVILSVSILVSTYLIYWLFSSKTNQFDLLFKNIIFLGYILFSFMVLISIPISGSIYQPSIIIGIFILIWTNDTFAYIVGKSIGKNKLFERISPKKTIEGFIGGFVFSVLVGVLIAKYYVQTSVFVWIMTALIVSVFGMLGDLVESKFKRIANIKDSGNIMPGHGGILDRLDSVIFVAPFLFLFYKIIVYVS